MYESIQSLPLCTVTDCRMVILTLAIVIAVPLFALLVKLVLRTPTDNRPGINRTNGVIDGINYKRVNKNK